MRRRPSTLRLVLVEYCQPGGTHWVELTSSSQISIACCIQAVLIEVFVIRNRVTVLADTLQILEPTWVDLVFINEAVFGDLSGCQLLLQLEAGDYIRHRSASGCPPN
jgi:hypothetical protein